jgi:excisionase family DNA binding protein
MDELLTVAEAAKLLKVTPHTIYRWIAEGRLPAHRYSRRVIRLRRSDVEGFISARVGAIGEARVNYGTRTKAGEAEIERDQKEVRHLLDKYREAIDRPRPAAEPRPGSKEALLRVAGSITHEEAEELRRVIREAKTYSAPVEL